jgi:hypothetical protein
VVNDRRQQPQTSSAPPGDQTARARITVTAGGRVHVRRTARLSTQSGACRVQLPLILRPYKDGARRRLARAAIKAREPNFQIKGERHNQSEKNQLASDLYYRRKARTARKIYTHGTILTICLSIIGVASTSRPPVKFRFILLTVTTNGFILTRF